MSADSELLTMNSDRDFDRWPSDKFDSHCSAEGISLHAHRRMGGPPIFSLGIVTAVANAVLELNDKYGMEVPPEEVDGE